MNEIKGRLAHERPIDSLERNHTPRSDSVRVGNRTRVERRRDRSLLRDAQSPIEHDLVAHNPRAHANRLVRSVVLVGKFFRLERAENHHEQLARGLFARSLIIWWRWRQRGLIRLTVDNHNVEHKISMHVARNKRNNRAVCGRCQKRLHTTRDRSHSCLLYIGWYHCRPVGRHCTHLLQKQN